MSSIIPVNKRKLLLKKLLITLKKYENEVTDALYKDFKKSSFETFLTEFNYVVSDLKYAISNIEKWTKPKRVWPSIMTIPSSDFIYSEPYGRVLIIAPWNYPFQLAFSPLIAAISAGNTVVLKPSELSFQTSQIITKIVEEVFDVKEAVVVHGGPEFAQSLLEKKWDYIFFTGSVAVGKIVAQAAAKHLTPVTLELGGKNPCIIDEGANLEVAAKRIVWGKFVNAGQTCIAPDYILIQAKEKYDFIELVKKEIIVAYGENQEESKDFPRIISSKHWKRLSDLIEPSKVIFGGITIENDKYISPTLIDEPEMRSELMKDEIFGPILPIISYSTEHELQSIIHKFEKPLALYVFSNNKKFAEKMITEFSFGGGCVNDCMVHFANKRLPFGGVGNSGIGAYHGKLGFDTFSHKKTIVKRPNWGDNPIRYAPYNKKSNFIKKVISWLT
ncbi:aldehyde dehydrogenase [Flavobacterium orientale]|uniref:Aldehyde dehydrogenase n=1 Tax=Flavobacterium orientale TaxID=1756020 RepID=A0A916XWB3_9FLAO|nr:aldehyde dehydrogenase [Flavobacterium orientale]GGD16486.1 aldehyde dehydrogenase [Flavobacterium orientale]